MKTLNFDPRDPYYYNPIINSNFDHWQRFGSAVTTLSSSGNAANYVADRFAAGVSPAGVTKSISVERSTLLPSSLYPSTYSLQVTNNAAVSPLTGAEFIFPFEQRMEGLVFRPLHGNNLTFGTWIFPSFTGTVAIAFRRNNVVRNYTTVVSVVANQWQYIVANVPHDSSGPAQTFDNGNGYNVLVGCLSGPTYQAPSLNTWQNGDFISHASVTNWASTVGNFMRFSQPQIRVGYRTSLEMQNGYVPYAPNYHLELDYCKRYYEWVSEAQDYFPWGNGSNSSLVDFSIQFKIEKRAVPAMSWDGNGNNWRIWGNQTGAAYYFALTNGGTSFFNTTRTKTGMTMTSTNPMSTFISGTVLNAGGFVAANAEF